MSVRLRRPVNSIASTPISLAGSCVPSWKLTVMREAVRFQFAPMEVRIGSDEWVRATRNGKRGLLMRVFASAPFDAGVRQGVRDPMEGWFSPAGRTRQFALGKRK